MKTLSEFLKDFKLNWKVTKKSLFYKFKNRVKTSDWFGLVRSDNGVNLGICKGVYEPVQNSELLKTLLKIGKDLGFELKTGGYINQGEKTYFFLENPEPLTIGKDTIIRSIFALNSHDRSQMVSFGYANKVLSCQNQFNKFYNNSKFQFKHSKSAKNKMAQIPFNFQQYLKVQQRVEEIFKKFVNTPIKDNLIKDLTIYLFELEKKDPQEYRTRLKNKLHAFKSAINHEINSKGSNLWGLFNGVTYYTNHKTKFSNKKHNSALDSIYCGAGYTLSNKAFEYLAKVVSL